MKSTVTVTIVANDSQSATQHAQKDKQPPRNHRPSQFLSEKRWQMRIAILTMAISLHAFPGEAVAAQRIVFCADSIKTSNTTRSYRTATAEECKDLCRRHAPEKCLEPYLEAGWKITSSTGKDLVQTLSENSGNCGCVGTEYVLTNSVQQSPDTSTSPEETPDKREIQLLRKENELLRAEIEMLKKEVSTLKQPHSPTKKAR
jgi:hypothetical protein